MWFAVYMLSGWHKDEINGIKDSLIGQDTYMKNLEKTGIDLNQIGINTVAFEYAPWHKPDDRAGRKSKFL
mgnify:CR=1 FL=1